MYVSQLNSKISDVFVNSFFFFSSPKYLESYEKF